MSRLNNCKLYCLSYSNKKKCNDMIERFQKLEMECHFYFGISSNDKRIRPTLTKYNKRNLSITYSHLDIIYDFYYNSDDKFAIICEDDIIIHKQFKEIMEKAISDFTIMNLDILLLGYLLPYKISDDPVRNNFQLKHSMPKDSMFKYYCIPDYISGTHMYLINKSYARFILKTYYYNYTEIMNKYFMIDKILLSDSNRALIYPMVSVENNEQSDPYHKLCHKIHSNNSYL